MVQTATNFNPKNNMNITNPLSPVKNLTPEQECKNSGGVWDAKTQSCIRMPKATAPVQTTNTPQAPTAEQKPKDLVYRDADKGNISGVSVNGKDYLGLKPSDVEKILKAKELREKGGVATQAFEKKIAEDNATQQALAAQAEQQALGAQAAAGLGLTPQQIAEAEAQASNTPPELGQAAIAGINKAAPSALLTAAGSLAAGSGVLAATGVGAPVAAGTIAVAGTLYTVAKLWGGVQSNIAQQQKGEVSAAQDVLAKTKTDMRVLATLAAKDPANAQRYVEAYNQRLAQVYTARRKIYLETQGNLNRFTEDGTDILSDFDLFLQPMGQAELYKIKLDMALQTGIPPELDAEDVAGIESG